MSSWIYVLTNKGRQLQAKAQTGVELKYTRMAVGSGTLAGQALAAMTALITPVKKFAYHPSKASTRSDPSFDWGYADKCRCANRVLFP